MLGVWARPALSTQLLLTHVFRLTVSIVLVVALAGCKLLERAAELKHHNPPPPHTHTHTHTLSFFHGALHPQKLYDVSVGVKCTFLPSLINRMMFLWALSAPSSRP